MRLYRFSVYEAAPSLLSISFFYSFFWAQIVVGVFAAEKPASPESPGSKQLDSGSPREVTRNGIRFVYYQRSHWETNRGSRNWSGGGGRGRFRD
jgi:hypothetical protein